MHQQQDQINASGANLDVMLVARKNLWREKIFGQWCRAEISFKPTT